MPILDRDFCVAHGSSMATKTRNISLPSALDAFVEAKVKAGRYGNASAVVQAGLRALEREEMGEL